MVNIIRWSDRTANAKEVNHKTYYFKYKKLFDLTEALDDEDMCCQIYNKYPQYTKLTHYKKGGN